MKEYYPYTVVPFLVEKVRSEGIPAPKLPKLMLLPEPVRRKYLGTVIFALSLSAFIFFTVFTSRYIIGSYLSFFIALISLVATIFEFVQYSNLKKQYARDYELYLEHKEIYKKLKADQEKINEQNKNAEIVKEYQKSKVHEFFKTSYNIIIAVHNEYSPAKKRFKLFLEEYFPDEILENVKVVHEAKKLEYVPDFIIKFDKPKLNVAIEIEEPYTLSNVPENIQKDYEAKDRIRQRFANELGWIVIVLSEEQAVISPTESCKFVEESIELLFGDVKMGDRFVNIKTIKKQKMLTGEERANLKNTKYREKYLTEAGLLDIPYDTKKEILEVEPIIIKNELNLLVQNNNGNGKIQEENIEAKNIVELNNKVEDSKISEIDITHKISEDKKIEIENEQMILIKKIAQKAKIVSDLEDKKIIEHEPIIYKTDDSLEINKQEAILEESLEITADVNVKTEETVQIQNNIDTIADESVEITTNVEDKTDEPVQITANIDDIAEEAVDLTTDIEEKLDENIDEQMDTEPKDELTKKGEQLRREEDILKDLYNALDKKSRKQKERKEKRLREKLYGHGEHTHEQIETNEKISESAIEKTIEEEPSKLENLIEKDEKFEEQKMNEILVETKTIDSIEPVLEKIEEEKVEVEIVNQVILDEEKSKEIKIETLETNIELNKIVELETEDVTKIVKEESVSEKQVLIEEPEKNEILIDAYREKIEGAVFDKHWDELIVLCNKAIEEIPDWDWAYYRRSTAWGNRKEFVKVIDDCTKAIGLNPSLADAYYNRGTARFFLGKYKDASEDYQKSIDLNYVKKADAHFNRGLCFQKLEHEKIAYLEFVKAKELGSAKAIDYIKKQYQAE